MKQLRRYTTRERMHSPAYPLPQTQGSTAGEMSHVIIQRSCRFIYRNRFGYDKAKQMRSPEAIILHQRLCRHTLLRMCPQHRSHDQSGVHGKFSVRKGTE